MKAKQNNVKKTSTSTKRALNEVVVDNSGVNSDGEENLLHADGLGNDQADETDSESSVYSDLSDEEDESVEVQSDAEISDGDNDDVELDDNVKTDASHDENKHVNNEPKIDEYAYDSSDEEDIRNTIGNIPIKWYDEFDHIGYDLDGKKIIKPIRGDQLDDFLSKMDDPNYWRTVKDHMTGQDVILTDEDVEFIQRIQRGRFPDSNFDAFEPWTEFFTNEKMIHPVTSHPAQKRSFIPSKIEKETVSKMVHAIKMGWIKPKKKVDDKTRFYLLWDNDDSTDINKRMQHHIPAPKLKLPGHEESYNPPPEYLFSKEEEEDWNNQEPEDRKQDFIPHKYSSLRLCPAYLNFAKERFERCLDLYLCPRQRKMRVHVDPEDLIPKLPKPRDLQPFPTTLSLKFLGHTDLVRTITVESSGQYLASGSDDGTVRIWEVSTGRCIKTYNFNRPVKCVAWCPNVNAAILAVAIDKNVFIMNANVGDKLVISNTDAVLTSSADQNDSTDGDSKSQVVSWREASEEEADNNVRLCVEHSSNVKVITWHSKGDYLATVMPDGGLKSVVIHQLSKKRSQTPFSKSKGMVQTVLFHPTRPYLFVATQRYVRVYNLMKQELAKKLLTNCKWVSCMAVHPQGDNLMIGSYDSRLSWFDLDLSTKPYKTLRHHKKAIRQVAFHKRYPLFASASDDCSLIVCHGMVYNDLLQNPLIVPVKVLRGHKSSQDLGVLDCIFHPTQPWLFSSASDCNIHLYT